MWRAMFLRKGGRMGQSIKLHGIVLNKTDYKDNDRILTLFSPEKGKMTVSARGVKKQNSKLRSGSELFAFGNYVLNETKGRFTVTAYDSVDPFTELRDDFDRLAFGTLMLKITDKTALNGEGDPELFSLLIRSLDKLRTDDIPPSFVSSVFLLRLCSLAGYEPVLDRCVSCGEKDGLIFLSPPLGGTVCKNCANNGHFAVSGACLYSFKRIISAEFEDVFLFKPTDAQRKELFRAAAAYTAYFFDEKIKILDYISKYNLI